MEAQESPNLVQFFADLWEQHALSLGVVASLVLAFTLLTVIVVRRKRKPTAVSAASATIAPPLKAPLMADDVAEVRALDHETWLKKLQQGLSKTRQALESNLLQLFSQRRPLDHATLERLHEVLYRADVGVKTADKLVAHVEACLQQQTVGWPEVEAALREKALKFFASSSTSSSSFVSRPANSPRVILVVGVNGVGKTTTIGKLAAHFMAQDQSVLLCAADTYRAAAIDQLKVWGDRLGVKVIAHQAGSDPAAVAYDGVKAAIARKYDTLLIDTAGRLHSKSDLMAELRKIYGVIGKDLPGAPHECWLVIDATTGQNAVQQVKAFSELVQLTGLVVTKLDGTAKGGVILSISDQYPTPILYLGVGEKASDLRAFNANDYVGSLFSSSASS